MYVHCTAERFFVALPEPFVQLRIYLETYNPISISKKDFLFEEKTIHLMILKWYNFFLKWIYFTMYIYVGALHKTKKEYIFEHFRFQIGGPLHF